MKKLVAHPWFALADLILVALSILLLEVSPGLGGLPLLLGILSWLARVLAGRFPFQRTRFDWLLLIFLITAAVGTWTAYDPGAAWQKFWLIAGGMLLFYALAGQPSENHWRLAWAACWLGAGIAVYFLLVNDWQAYPTKMRLVNEVGSWWMHARPSFLADRIPAADIADPIAGYLAFVAPLWFAAGTQTWKERKPGMWAGFLVCGALMGAAFLLANSWDTAVALGVGMSAWAVWAAAESFGRRYTDRRSKALGAAAVVAAALLLGVLFIAAGGPQALYYHYAANFRQDVAFGGYKLAGDFLFTGAGLGSFAGLYSQYIIGVPYFYAANSHNLYLDVILEQGLVGLLALAAVFTGSVWMLVSAGRKAGAKILLQVVFSSLVILLLQGLVDEILYGPHSAFLLFAVPGMACAVSRPWEEQGSKRSHTLLYILLVVIAGLGILFLLRWQALSGAFHANLGAVQVAKVELKNFPANAWIKEIDLQAFAPAEARFQAALEHDPGQRAALMHLGRNASARRDFSAAVSYLERAQQVDPTHPGIVKALAFNFAWDGQFDKAAALMRQVPGARQELNAYASWWKEQGQEDLSAKATQVLALLDQ